MGTENKFRATVSITPSQAAALEALGITVETVDEFDMQPKEYDSSMAVPTMTDGAQDQAIEPENIDKICVPDPFVKAQISTKNQMILRNILAVISSLSVVIVFILEKLGVM